ncbi:MAG: hypothetical protein Kow009_05330 [Spirochaetales bacterium]
MIDLPSAIRMARERNLELSLSFSQQRIEEEQHRLACLQFLPRISLGYSRNDTVIYHYPDTYLQRISLGLEQEIYDRGKRRSDLRTEEKTLRLRRRILSLQEEELSLRIAELFLQSIGLRVQGEILDRAMETTREQSRIARTELSLGQITESDYLAILLKEKDLGLEQTALRREEEQILFELRAFLGSTDQELYPQGRIDTTYEGFLPLDGEMQCMDRALRNSTDLEELAIQREALGNTLEQVRSSWLPSIAVRVELSMEGREFPLTQPGMSIAVKLAWDTPVVPFSMGMQAGKQGSFERTRGFEGEARLGENVERIHSVPLARLNLERTEIQYTRTREEVRFQLSQAFSILREKSQRLQLLREKNSILEKKMGIQRLRLSLGEVTRLEFLEAEIERFRLQGEILGAITGLFLQETSILKLCGRAAYGNYPIPLLPEPDPTKSGDSGTSSRERGW